jgi:hypothetical protein
MNYIVLKITAGVTLAIFTAELAGYRHSLAKQTDHEAPDSFAITLPSSNTVIVTVQDTVTGEEIEFVNPTMMKVTISST